MSYRLLSLALGAFLVTIPGFTQTKQAGAVHEHNWEQARQQWFDRAAAALNLTETQKSDARATLDAAHREAQPVHQEMMQVRRSLFDAVKADHNAEIDRLSRQQGELMGRLVAIQTRAFAKIYSTLTPDQKVKADQFYASMRQHWGMHEGMHQGVKPQS